MQWVERYEAKLKAATPGPWYWHGVKKHHDVALVSTKNGHSTVMDFVRWGMNGSAPRFKANGVLERVDSLAEPRQAHRPDGEFYQVHHPDAVFIASSPEMVAKLIAAVRIARGAVEWAANGQFANRAVEQACMKNVLAQLQSGEFPKEDA